MALNEPKPKKRPRKRFTDRQVLETLLHQGVVILCHRCDVPFSLEKDEDVEAGGFMIASQPNPHWVGRVQREHLHEHGLDGPDTPANCRYSCEASHKVVTFGTKATTAGSSKARMAKADRIAAGGRKPKGKPFRKPPEGYKHNWGPKRPMGRRA